MDNPFNRPRPKKWIGAWLGMLVRSIVQPKRLDPVYRGPTLPRRGHHAGSWRSVNGGLKCFGKRAIRRHKQWSADLRRERKAEAERQHWLHDIGITPAKRLSSRTHRRFMFRTTAKHIGA
jgi:hypothetical protein